ncbi:MAG: hypothetical protein EOO43_25220 [Flavobacterium sp.]|nr:MAG: hypothetical protein EOO43_25220 [Flavobacterium sp.]
MNDYLRSIQMLIDDGFRKLIKHNTPINAAYTYNSDHAFILNEDKIELNYPEIMFSVGDVEGPEAPELSSENGLIILKWFNMPQSLYCQYSDKASVLIYEPNKKSSIIYKSAGIRSELEVALKAHCYVNKDVHCFISFSSADGKRQGNSIYLGMLKVLN